MSPRWAPDPCISSSQESVGRSLPWSLSRKDQWMVLNAGRGREELPQGTSRGQEWSPDCSQVSPHSIHLFTQAKLSPLNVKYFPIWDQRENEAQECGFCKKQPSCLGFFLCLLPPCPWLPILYHPPPGWSYFLAPSLKNPGLHLHNCNSRLATCRERSSVKNLKDLRAGELLHTPGRGTWTFGEN